jgi:hypothetical protein
MSTAVAPRLAALTRQVAALAAATTPPLSAVQLAEAAGIAPDPWQAAILAGAAPRLLLNVCRQAGKSTIAAVLAVHTALYAPGALVLLLSPSLRQSGELFRKCLDVYGAVSRLVPAEAESALRLELENGSRIVSLPGKEATIRGYSGVRLLVADEASRIPDELYYSVRPMLAVSGGRLLAMSTPYGRRGWWYDALTEGDGWERVTVRATECPRIPPAFLEEERATMPRWFYLQEYECEPQDDAGTVFSGAAIAAAFTPDVRPLYDIGAA